MGKEVYFVRHGLSTANEKRQFQDADDPLSEIGKKQAEVVAKRFASYPVDLIISSPYQRARMTAEIINEVVQKPLIFSDFLVENRVPKQIVGKDWEDPHAKEIRDLIKERYHLEHWHHSDEENFFDVKHRAEGFLNMLGQREEQYILVVTHGFILKMITSLMIYGDHLTPDLFIPYDRAHMVSNTGITLCKKEENQPWEIVTFNDRLHLLGHDL